VSDLEVEGVPPGAARTICAGIPFEDAAKQQEKMLRSGAILLPYLDPHYPPGLKDLTDPPLLLFVRGDAALLAMVGIGVVGTRKPTPYGVAVAERLGKDLAAARVNVVSGMARGVDTAAHRGALAAAGATTAVLGCGVDITYPSENRRLHAEIAERGVVISEFPMGSAAFPQNFPIRNRIVAALSAGVVIVEGTQYSGSAITARLALDHGRELFAVPGNITSPLSFGPNLLIRQGAKVCTGAEDVVLELEPEIRRRIHLTPAASNPSGGRSEAAEGSLSGLGPNQGLGEEILRVLHHDRPTHIDDLLECLENYSSSEIIAVLFELELLGRVKQMAGRQYVKPW
jgi:DNA processing protein